MFGTHYRLERKSVGFALGIILVASIGGLVEIAPLFTIDETVETAPDMRTYTPLELAGRNIYIREGCYACHSQMIRTLRDEVERYGPYSLAVESKYDHPMLWGSKRTGPDLARIGGKYSDQWQVAHLMNPRDVGVPYTDAMIAHATEDAIAQANPDGDTAGLTERYGKATHVRTFDGNPETVTEMDALVAYLQILGQLTDAAHKLPIAKE